AALAVGPAADEPPPAPVLEPGAPQERPAAPWSTAPAAAAASAAPPSRTASGLVKRSRRAPDSPLAATLDGDLLASLSSITGHLGPGAHAPATSTGPDAAPGPTASKTGPLPSRPAGPTPPPAPVLREPDRGIGAGRPRSWPAPPGSRAPSSPFPSGPATRPPADADRY